MISNKSLDNLSCTIICILVIAFATLL
ncbi:unknown protein [Lactococcus lactis subsp. lactis IO-1]|nr:unknown protein [Lactococcus lactis subsp. lactis IO-1]